ncbi:MAG: hypothetical protein ACNA7J_14735 [Wenzhouxiangella sp.]
MLVILTVVACGGATAPAESSGEQLTGSVGVNCNLSEPFSFSPDRRWLAFVPRVDRDAVVAVHRGSIRA